MYQVHDTGMAVSQSTHTVDAHYASALFRYQRELAIHYRQYCTMVRMNEKHTVKVGEPSCPVAGVEGGSKSESPLL